MDRLRKIASVPLSWKSRDDELTSNRRELLSLLGIGSLAPGFRVAREPERPADSSLQDRSSIGNLFQQVGAYAQAEPPRLSFLNSQWKDLDQWKLVAREKVSDRLGYQPPLAPFNERTLSKRKRNGYVQEELTFQTTPYTEVPATMLIPDGPPKPRPALVALHDHGGFYYFGREKLLEPDQRPPVLVEFCQKIYEGVPYAAELARRGYVVLAIDAFYFGQRRLREDSLPAGRAGAFSGLQPGSDEFIRQYNKFAGSYEPLVAKTIFMAGGSWPGMILWDDLRTVDYLATRREVDKERIGCLGLSLGGIRAAYLAGCHPAIRSAVVTCWMSTFGPMLANYPERHTWMCYAPGLYQFLDLPDVASMTAPNWLLVQYGRKDDLFPRSGKEQSADKISQVYAKAGVSRRFKPSFFDSPHMFSKAMQKEAYDWFENTLQI